MDDDAIDLVIPAYQAERWLGAAIESVLAQRGAPLGQVLVVDNGSSDGTAAVARRFPAPVRLLTTGRTGAAHARNVGLAACRAPLVAFLDADDLLPPDSLAVRWRAFRSNPRAELVAGRVLPFRDGRPPPADCDAAALRPWAQRGLVPGSILLRRALFDRFGLCDESLRGTELIDWLLKATGAGVTPLHLDRVVLLRRLHGASLSQAARGQVNADYLTILRRHLRRRDGQG